MRWWHRGGKGDDGAQAVEFALIFLFVLGPAIFGLLALGLGVYQQIGVSQLAREAARSAAICAGDPTKTAGECAAAGENAVYDSLSDTVGGEVTASMTDFGCPDGSVTMTVSVEPIIGLPDFAGFGVLNTISGRSTTPCGG